MVQQKVKCEQLMAQGRDLKGPKVTEFTMYRPYTQEELVNSGKRFQQMHREPSAARLLHFGRQGVAPAPLWGFLQVLTERSRGMECEIPFGKV